MDSAAQHIEELESGHLAPDDGDDDDDEEEEEDEHEREAAVGGSAAPDVTAAQLAEPQVGGGVRVESVSKTDAVWSILTIVSQSPVYILCVSVLHIHFAPVGKTVARARA